MAPAGQPVAVGNKTGSSESLASAEIIGWKPLENFNQNPLQGHSQEPSPSDITNASTAPSAIVDRMPNSPYSFKCPISHDVLKEIDPGFRKVDEFRYLTYTPVTCQPEAFVENGYKLRPNLLNRHTELLIAITMYNESDEFLGRTLSAVFRNIRYFTRLNQHLYPKSQFRDRRSSSVESANQNVSPMSKVGDFTYVKNAATGLSGSHSSLEAAIAPRGEHIWSEHAWQKIVVVIISDGRLKCHKRVLDMLQTMGVYQDEVRLDQALDPTDDKRHSMKPVTAHLYETTCQVIVDEDRTVKSGSRSGVVPVQLMFCLKEQNLKKLNSHRWLFRAIAPALNPFACVLIDVGTRPKTEDSIYWLWRSFDRNHRVAGCCGEICVQLGGGCSSVKSILQPLVASQNFEYKMSNILDKTLESCFGYISVLPGAFSAYRWEALQDLGPEEGPLVAYFKHPTDPNGNVFASNMYLAEDRILCLELVGKRDSDWVLQYVSDASAETDVPSTVSEFLAQRRRWLNGTFFCQIYAIAHLGRFWKTRHSVARKLALTMQFLYFTASMAFSWFGLANFYLSFYLIAQQTFSGNSYAPGNPKSLIFFSLNLLYSGIIVAMFITAMGNRPQGAKLIYLGSVIIFAAIMIFLLVVTVILVVQSLQNLPANGQWLLNGGTSRDIVLSLLSTYGVYLISGLIYGQAAHVISCLVQYLLMLPSYINTLSIYAFCNSHDVSWGTKGDDLGAAKTDNKSGSQKMLSADNQQFTGKAIPPLQTAEQLSLSYQRATNSIRTPPPREYQHRDLGTKREDYYRSFRTWLVLGWVLCNGLLVAVVSSPTISILLTGDGDPNKTNPYMAILMYSVVLFTLIRFFGAIGYMVNRKLNK